MTEYHQMCKKARKELEKAMPSWCSKTFPTDLYDYIIRRDVYDQRDNSMIDFISDLHNFIVNSKSLWDDSLDTLLLKFYMWKVHNKHWDKIKKDWV